MDFDAGWGDQDLYATLGVDPDASTAEITKAYRRLARELHPDTNPSAAAEERFKAASRAYDVLRDADRRAAYDQALRTASRARRRQGGGYTIRVQNLDDSRRAADAQHARVRTRASGGLFDDLFHSARGGRTARPHPGWGADIRAELSLPFTDAVIGTTRTVAVPGHGPVTVQVPPGVEDGQTVRVPGMGRPNSGGGAPGDLLVTVHVDPDPVFGRQGQDLTITVPVSYREAALGADVTVPTIQHGPVTIRIPPGTPSGQVLRVRGRGLPARDGTGDLLVTVQVDVPTSLDDRQRELIGELARYDDPDRRAHLEARRADPPH